MWIACYKPRNAGFDIYKRKGKYDALILETGNRKLKTVVYLLETGDWKLFFNLLSTFNQPGTAILWNKSKERFMIDIMRNFIGEIWFMTAKLLIKEPM